MSCVTDRSIAQASEARVSELEAQASTFSAANARLSQARDALVDDAFNAEDLLSAAADRMRRSRETRRKTTAAAGDDGTSVADTGSTAAAAATATATATGGLPARSLFLDSRRAGEADVAGSAEFASAGGDGGGGGRLGARRGRRRASPLSTSLSASTPVWHGGGGGGGRAGGSRGAWEEEEEDDVVEGERIGEEGVGMDGALVVVSAAAMDVLRELEHMHVGVGWWVIRLFGVRLREIKNSKERDLYS